MVPRPSCAGHMARFRSKERLWYRATLPLSWRHADAPRREPRTPPRDAVASRIDSAVRMKQVTKTMAGIVVGLEKAMATMDMAKITQVMDQFDKQLEDLGVQSEYIENTMSQSTSITTPADQVDTLISQVAEEHGLEISEKLGTAVPSSHTAAVEQDDLTERLAKLKSKT